MWLLDSGVVCEDEVVGGCVVVVSCDLVVLVGRRPAGCSTDPFERVEVGFPWKLRSRICI